MSDNTDLHLARAAKPAQRKGEPIPPRPARPQSIMERFDSLRSFDRDPNQTLHEFIGAVAAHLKSDPDISIGDVMERFVTAGEAELIARIEPHA